MNTDTTMSTTSQSRRVKPFEPPPVTWERRITAARIGTGTDVVVGVRQVATPTRLSVRPLVIVDGDPLADIKNARKVDTVIKNGRVLTMKELMTGMAIDGAAPRFTEAQLK